MKKLLGIISIIFSITLILACTPSDNSPRAFLGNADAPNLIEEFSDFECPACAIISPQLEDMVRKNPDIARLEFHYFPLNYHKYAFKAAEAAECTNDQGKFWKYAKVLFKNQKNLTQDALVTYAQNLKLDTTIFEECLNSGAKQGRIKNDMNEAHSRQLKYTPSIYVNGQLVKWSESEEFEKYLKSL